MKRLLLLMIIVSATVNANADGLWGNDATSSLGRESTETSLLFADARTGIDDYTRFFGPLMTVGLKLGGYEGHSDWPRLAVSGAMSYGITTCLIYGLKNTATVTRPDGSSNDSWPSGHAAIAFAGATILHKEYGRTRSPWFSVAGYGMATTTGMMRILHNRHWASDVLSGAGIGIMSTELAYALSDMIFKEKGLLRHELERIPATSSFFSISVGLGLSGKDIDFGGNGLQVKFRPATVADAEGAYFLNRYVGVGGRLRVRSTAAKSFGDLACWGTFYRNGNSIIRVNGIANSNHLTEFTPSAGLFLNLPLNDRFSLGTKMLVGRSFMQELDIDGQAESSTGDEPFAKGWDCLTVDAGDATSLGTGIAMTYRYKAGFAWKVFCDYDVSKKDYTMTHCPLYDAAPITYKKTKTMHDLTVGASFAIHF